MSSALLQCLAILKEGSLERVKHLHGLNEHITRIEADFKASQHVFVGGPAKSEHELVEELIVKQQAVAFGIKALQGCKLLVVDANATNSLQRLESVILGAQSGDTVVLRPGAYSTPICIKQDGIIVKGGSGGTAKIANGDGDVKSVLVVDGRYGSVIGIAVEQNGLIGSALLCNHAVAALSSSSFGRSASFLNAAALQGSSARLNRSGSVKDRLLPPTTSMHPETVVFTDCEFCTASFPAAVITSGAFRFERCTFTSGRSFGIRIRPTDPTAVIHVTLVGCRFTNCNDGGIFLSGSEVVSVRLSKCVFDGTNGSGVHIHSGSAAGLVVEETVFSDYGIAAILGEEGNISCVRVERCRASDIGRGVLGHATPFVGTVNLEGLEEGAPGMV